MPKKIIERKRVKQLARTLLPDAPPPKRTRKQQLLPKREECHLVSGTPTTPPQPRLQPWQKRSLDTTSPTNELAVDWTTGQLRTQASSEQAPPALPNTPPQKPLVRVLPVSEINRAIRGSAPAEKASSHLENSLEGSESDEDEEVDGKTQGQTYGMDIINLQPAHIDDLDKDLLDWVTNDDNLSDRHIRQLLRTAEQFNFDWSHDHMKFTGRKETFTGQSGPTFELTDDTKPIDIFCKFFDDDIWDLLTRQTNKYGKVQKLKTTALNSRLKCWTDVDKNEMAIVLAILILQGLVSLPCETNYWRENGYLTLKYFKDLMTYNRFLLIMRLLHFSDVTDTTALRLTKDERKLRKIKPVLDFLNKKFSALYLPGQNIGIGESLLKWKGPLSFAQKIATKAAQVGVKSYELCESTTGYLWSFFVYTGKVRFKIDDDSNIDRQTNPKDTQTETPTDRAADRPSDRPTGGPTDRQTDRRIYRNTNRQINRQTE